MPKPAPPIHLLRYLLRECSYLPDTQARLQIPRMILQRFRVDRDSHQRYLQDPESPNHVSKHLKDGRQALSLLRSANTGALGPLTRVIMFTYGRLGRRRRELLEEARKSPEEIQPFLILDAQKAPSDQSAVGELVAARLASTRSSSSTNPPRELDFFGPTHPQPKAIHFLPASLVAVLHSQAKQRFTVRLRDQIKPRNVSEPKIDQTNNWGNPMPRKRVKNKTKKWFAKLLNSALPPLSIGEWEHLRDKVNGVDSWEGVPTKRCQGNVRAHMITPNQEILNTGGISTDINSGSVPSDLLKWDESSEAVMKDELESWVLSQSGLKVEMVASPQKSDRVSDIKVEQLILQPDISDYAQKESTSLDVLPSPNTSPKQVHYSRARRPHVITGRYMRRILGRVFIHCPIVRWNECGNNWEVEWGRMPGSESGSDQATEATNNRSTSITENSPPSLTDEDREAMDRLFGGVDTSGRIEYLRGPKAG
jgi:hypothetical protein